MKFRTPAVARAMMSPTGILLAGGGAALGIVASGGIAGAVVLAVLAWAGRVGYAVVRQPRAERIDPFTLQEPWRQLVNKAQWTARRFEDAVAKAKDGPLKERLTEVGRRVDDAVTEAWAIAKRGHALDEAVDVLDLPSVRQQLAAAQAKGGGPDQQGIVTSLRNQLDSGERLAGVAEDAKTRLQRLNTELDESVARAVELSLAGAEARAIQPLGSEVENVVGELEALRLALEETDSGQ
ncbi:MAG: hypothetical protein ACRD1K_02250, partial [Acidimicrobiales bacterium]